ncbi:hypothetical protein [Pseudomonas sp. M30-35]|uniref:hypothetical protein n=1 Tax=Pseudomonas sp. M30-35 TaxID=1981174 RepID=UPI000B3C3C09|nr:hypothetical protein [Pseudomonas sp. M30-35]ARU88440.1 hypothetical protein B9K09_10910 [Pseudomonas sp. M30-35]
MNTISPYTIRSFDPLKKAVKIEDNYASLGAVGASDTYKIFKEFILSKGNDFHIIKEAKQIYCFSSFKFNDVKRTFCGIVKVGTYGARTDIINIDTGRVDFKRLEKNAEVLNHYVQFYVPVKQNEGIVLLHNQRNVGIKTLLHDLLREAFSKKTNRILQMNPLAYEKAFDEWRKAVAKEIKLVKFKGMGAIEDQIKKLGHDETEKNVIIKAPRKSSLGTLSDYFTAGSDQFSAIEMLTPLCSEVKAVVEIDGRKRTFKLGGSHSGQVCEIDIDEDHVTVIAGNPDMLELHKWCTTLMNEFLASMYPKMGIKI